MCVCVQCFVGEKWRSFPHKMTDAMARGSAQLAEDPSSSTRTIKKRNHISALQKRESREKLERERLKTSSRNLRWSERERKGRSSTRTKGKCVNCSRRWKRARTGNDRGKSTRRRKKIRRGDRRRRRGGDETAERRRGIAVRVAHRGGRVHERKDTRYVFNWLKFSIERRRKRDDPLLRVCVSSSVVFLSLSLCV